VNHCHGHKRSNDRLLGVMCGKTAVDISSNESRFNGVGSRPGVPLVPLALSDTDGSHLWKSRVSRPRVRGRLYQKTLLCVTKLKQISKFLHYPVSKDKFNWWELVKVIRSERHILRRCRHYMVTKSL